MSRATRTLSVGTSVQRTFKGRAICLSGGTSPERMPVISHLSGRRLYQPIFRYGEERREIPKLREPINESSEARKREAMWDGKCYRISVTNEVVHRHYRTLFEDIAGGKQLL